MKLGLITDIHERNDLLQDALACFRRERVDQVVVIGDLFLLGEQIEETCHLLAEAGAIGVWGNHDFGICSEPTPEEREKYSTSTIEFLTTLHPRLEIGDCYFAHVEPWLNPEIVTDLWYYEGPPDTEDKLKRIFMAVPHRVIFAGHYHNWLLASPDQIHEWHGEGEISLSRVQRYFVVVGAVSEGRYAIYDSESLTLRPYRSDLP